MGAVNRASAKAIIAESWRGLNETSRDVKISLNEKYGQKSETLKRGLGHND